MLFVFIYASWCSKRFPYLNSPPVFQWSSCCSLVFWIVFCISFCSFSFDHCVVCPSSIYGFWLPLWYLQTFLNIICLLLYLVFTMVLQRCCTYYTVRKGLDMTWCDKICYFTDSLWSLYLLLFPPTIAMAAMI